MFIYYEETFVPEIGVMMDFAADIYVEFDSEANDHTVEVERLHLWDNEREYAPFHPENEVQKALAAALTRYVEKDEKAKDYAWDQWSAAA